jgi:predicted Zn-dependent protease
MSAAWTEAEFGNAERARLGVAAAPSLTSMRDPQIYAAYALARSGDTARAQTIADKLAKQFPLDTRLNGYHLPTIRAAIEISRKNPPEAIELLQAAAPYELGTVVGPGGLYPVYMRGQAYLLLRRGSDAAAEFQKFLDHRGIVESFPLGALAYLGLARAYTAQGDTGKARAAYQNFLALWKDADPDIPILQQARAEYATLQ